jgi:RNA polymerase sigma-70 factor, ECF subfamily
MLGSLHDADDALQDALIRAWRGITAFDGRGAFLRWLYRIATNASLDGIARRPKRVLPIDYGPPGERDALERRGPVTEPERYSDELLGVEGGSDVPEARYERRETMELALVALVHHLPSRQRAALILREVLGFRAKEVSEWFETTPASVNSALQRARKAVDERPPESSHQPTLGSIGDERLRTFVRRFVDAIERGDVDAVVALLKEDAAPRSPPACHVVSRAGRLR